MARCFPAPRSNLRCVTILNRMIRIWKTDIGECAHCNGEGCEKLENYNEY